MLDVTMTQITSLCTWQCSSLLQSPFQQRWGKGGHGKSHMKWNLKKKKRCLAAPFLSCADPIKLDLTFEVFFSIDTFREWIFQEKAS